MIKHVLSGEIMASYEKHFHEIDPVYDAHSRILILGSFPSVKSREQRFFYGHPQNRFWKVIATVTDSPVPGTVEEKKILLLSHQIALWDVIQSCDIEGSSDASIKNVVPNPVGDILKKTRIEKIFGNGAKACGLYDRYLFPDIKIPIIRLPSTSPANAAYSFERLVEAWSIINLWDKR